MKRWMLLFLSLSLIFTTNSCIFTQEKIIYKDVPADHMIIKRDTLDKFLSEAIRTKQELQECLERESK